MEEGLPSANSDLSTDQSDTPSHDEPGETANSESEEGPASSDEPLRKKRRVQLRSVKPRQESSTTVEQSDVPFQSGRLHQAVRRAADSTGESVPVGRIVSNVVSKLEGEDDTPTVEHIQDLICDELSYFGFSETFQHYKKYRKEREKARKRRTMERDERKPGNIFDLLENDNPKELRCTLPAFIFDWHAHEGKTPLSDKQAIHVLSLRVPGQRSFGSSPEQVTQRVIFFTDTIQNKEMIVYGMICEEYPRQGSAYLAFLEKALPRKEAYRSAWNIEFIIRAYADFIALCYRGSPEKPTMLHIWPDPPTEKDAFFFLFRRPKAEKAAKLNSASSLSDTYLKWLKKNHVEEKMSFLLPPLTPLPQFGLRGSRDLSFKADPEIMKLDAKRRSAFFNAQMVAEKLEQKLHQNAMSFTLYPLLTARDVKFEDDTPWMWSDIPWPREQFKKAYDFAPPLIPETTKKVLEDLEKRWAKGLLSFRPAKILADTDKGQ